MIPDYQSLMRPVLVCAAAGETRIGDTVDKLADHLALTPEERAELLPSGKQTRFANRVNWAKAYLAKAGLVENTRRGYFRITPRGQAALADATATINNAYLDRFKEFQDFKAKVNGAEDAASASTATTVQGAAPCGAPEDSETPDEALRKAHAAITGALATDLLDRVRQATPAFFERLIVELLLAMGYGGTSEEAGRALGQSGDDGVDGVIDQDPLGVDQIFVQAKKYKDGNNIGAGAIRDFYGALSLKKAHKGIFVTTSAFSQPAIDTARGLGSRIVLIDGLQLSRLMIRYNVGCRDEEVLHLKKIDEDFFEP
ncbi:restriction endonuclease [Inhella sp.]|uniref:restriction endonuclease n=1 Tax=Inhella sp. TaxID=1921806 RepID=UPI0035AFE8F3